MVESFQFQPKRPMDFVPGQFVRVMLDRDNPNNKDLNKYLSLSCAPGKEYIEVTKRLSASLFSQALMRLKPGDEVLFYGPMGSCVLGQEDAKVGFITGGIGITPVISIIEHAAINRQETDIVLLYSNRRENEIAFKEKLDGWQAARNNIRIVHTITDEQPKGSGFLHGFIDKEMLVRAIPDWRDRRLFVYGPPAMVRVMQDICTEIGCDRGMIRVENFIGYE